MVDLSMKWMPECMNEENIGGAHYAWLVDR